MSQSSDLAGTFTLGNDLKVHRMGYGAMRLAGPHIWGPPNDPAEAATVLREAVAAGINHIDTSDYYGPHTVNHLIRETLHPYPTGLVLVTKVGNRRAPDKSWPIARSKEELTSAVHDNLRHLGLDALPVVNLRVGSAISGTLEESIAEPFTVLAELQRQGLIRHLGLSNITAAQLTEAQTIAPVVCVQNNYNLANRADDPLIDLCATKKIAFTPFFPLGGFSPLQSSVLDTVAQQLSATPLQVALAWLLQRSPNILLIPGTSSVAHLGENLAAALLQLTPEVVNKLNQVGQKN
jgi:pyridoxine 4-dehydrogenase